MRALITCMKFNTSKIFRVQMLPDGTRAEVARAWQWAYGAILLCQLIPALVFPIFAGFLTRHRAIYPPLYLAAILVLLVLDQVIGYYIYRRKLIRLS